MPRAQRLHSIDLGDGRRSCGAWGRCWSLVESEKLDMCGDQPHLICLVASRTTTWPWRSRTWGGFEEAAALGPERPPIGAALPVPLESGWLEAFENTHRTCRRIINGEG